VSGVPSMAVTVLAVSNGLMARCRRRAILGYTYFLADGHSK
jgi:hypothetical protein